MFIPTPTNKGHIWPSSHLNLEKPVQTDSFGICHCCFARSSLCFQVSPSWSLHKSWLFYHHFRAVVTVDCMIKAGGPSIDYYKAVCPVYGANWYVDAIFIFAFSNGNLRREKCRRSIATPTDCKNPSLKTKDTLLHSVSAGIIYILSLRPHSQLASIDLHPPPQHTKVSRKMILFLQHVPRHQDSTHLIHQLEFHHSTY